MKKGMKYHIDNGKGSYVCGLNVKNHIPEVLIDDENNQLFTMEGDPINHTNYQCVCTNCIKLFHPTYLNDLLNEKAIIDYKESLPKTNRQRARLNAKKRLNRNKAKKLSNVIQLPFVPVPVKPIALIEDKEYRNMDKKAKVIKKSIVKKPFKGTLTKKNEKPIELTEIVSIGMNDGMEDSFIQYSDGLAMVRGFGNQWMVVLNDKGFTESMTDWINRNEAEAMIKDLIAA